MLYKYLAPDRIDVLRAKRIRFTQAAALNDPFELRPYFEALVNVEEVRRDSAGRRRALSQSLRSQYDKQPSAFRAKVRFKTFELRAQALLRTEKGKEIAENALATASEIFEEATPGIRKQFEERLANHIGLLSLSEVPDGALMWAHYADHHRGYVVGFDEHHEFFDRRRSVVDEFFHLRKVVYSEARKFAAMTDMSGEDILLSKAPDWAYEQEWRMLVPLSAASAVIKQQSGDIHLFDFPAQCVRQVIIGARSSADLRVQIQDLARGSEFEPVTVSEALLDVHTAHVVIGE